MPTNPLVNCPSCGSQEIESESHIERENPPRERPERFYVCQDCGYEEMRTLGQVKVIWDPRVENGLGEEDVTVLWRDLVTGRKG